MVVVGAGYVAACVQAGTVCRKVRKVEFGDRLSMGDPFTADGTLEEIQDALGALVEERLAHWSACEGADAAWVNSEAGRHTLELIQVAIAVSEGLAAMRTLIVSGSGGDVRRHGDDMDGIFP